MNEKEFFGKDLLKSMSKTSKLHADYCASLKESKSILKRNFNKDRQEIRNDPVKDREADEFLGVKKSTEKIEYNDEKGNDFERQMTFVSEILPELKINIESN